MGRRRTEDDLLATIAAGDHVGASVPEMTTAGTTEEIPPIVVESPAPTQEESAVPAAATTAEGEPRKRRRRGPNRPKEPQQPVGPPAPSAEEMQALRDAFGYSFGAVFDMLAAIRGPHWKIDESTRGQLGTVWGNAFAPYMGGAGKWMPFALAGLTTVGVVMPRVIEDQQRVKALEAADSRNTRELAVMRSTNDLTNGGV